MRIMIVDDEADLTTLAGIAFELHQHETLKANSGEACFALLEKGPRPDIILLDLMIPEISGYEICKKLKSDSRFKTIPIIILSAKTSEQDIASGYQAGANGYITKPFNFRQLVKQLEEFVQKSK